MLGRVLSSEKNMPPLVPHRYEVGCGCCFCKHSFVAKIGDGPFQHVFYDRRLQRSLYSIHDDDWRGIVRGWVLLGPSVHSGITFVGWMEMGP